jgi:hypothetical protein
MERTCVLVRLGAERRMGATAQEMKDCGERQKPGDNPRGVRGDRPLNSKAKHTLSDLGTYDQSSKYQKPADVSEKDFEEAISPGTMPSTEVVIHQSTSWTLLIAGCPTLWEARAHHADRLAEVRARRKSTGGKIRDGDSVTARLPNAAE